MRAKFDSHRDKIEPLALENAYSKLHRADIYCEVIRRTFLFNLPNVDNENQFSPLYYSYV